MRKILFLLFSLVCITASAEDKYLSFTSGYVSKRDFKVKKNISESNNYVEVTYTFDGGNVTSTEGSSMLTIPEALYMMEKGSPKLPYYKDQLAIGSNSNVKISIVNSSYKEFSSFSILPSEGVVAESGTPAKGAVYSKNALYPSSIATLLSVNDVRDVPVVGINVYPVRYNPVTKKVRCYSSITYRISFDNKDWAIKGSKSRLDFVKTMVDNPDYIAQKLESKVNSSKSLRAAAPTSQEDVPEEYIILTTNKYDSAVRKLAEFKSRQGYKCSILQKSKWTSSEVISSLKTKYNSSTPSYLLIFGDFADVPGVLVTIATDKSPKVNNSQPLSFYTDKYFGNKEYVKTGNQNYYTPDVTVGRISVQNETEAGIVVDKIIKYEANPPANLDFYEKALFSGDWHCDYLATYIKKETKNFISPLEKLSMYFTNLNINKVYTIWIPTYIYNWSNNAEYSNVPYPTYLFDEKLLEDGAISDIEKGEEISDEYKGTFNNWYVRTYNTSGPTTAAEEANTKAKNEVLSLINEGTNFVVFGCHGYYDQLEAPAVKYSDINSLSNGELLPVVFCGMPCHTGNYKEYCLAESFLRKENGGAIAYIGNSTKGISPVSGYSTEKILKRIFLDNKTKVADVNNILWAQDLVDNEQLAIKKLFCLENHFFGDPAMDMFTTSPQCLNPIVTKNGNKVTVNTQGVKNCKITITDCGNPLNTDRMKVYTLQGNETKVVFDGIDYSYVVTVQKPNHYMYTSPIPDKYIQNETFEHDQIVSATNIYAGYNITEAKPYGNVVVKNGNISFKASNMISLKSGFSVKTTASKFEAKICEIDNEIEERECVQNTLKSLHITESQDEVANEKEDNAMLLFESYPNPTTDIININLRNEVADIIVYNSFGKTLRTITSVSGSISIDLSKYDKGIYFVTVKTDGHVETNKVVLQ